MKSLQKQEFRVTFSRMAGENLLDNVQGAFPCFSRSPDQLAGGFLALPVRGSTRSTGSNLPPQLKCGYPEKKDSVRQLYLHTGFVKNVEW